MAPALRVPHERLVSGVVVAASVYISTFMLVMGCGRVVGDGECVGSIVPVAGICVCVVSNAAVTAVRIMATAASAASGSMIFLLNFIGYTQTRSVYYILINNIGVKLRK